MKMGHDAEDWGKLSLETNVKIRWIIHPSKGQNKKYDKWIEK